MIWVDRVYNDSRRRVSSPPRSSAFKSDANPEKVNDIYADLGYRDVLVGNSVTGGLN